MAAETIVTKKNIWITANRSRVVEDGDPDAAYLLAAAGTEVAGEVVDHYGLKGHADKNAAAGTGADVSGRLDAQRRLANINQATAGVLTTAGLQPAPTPEETAAANDAAAARQFALEQQAHQALQAPGGAAPAAAPDSGGSDKGDKPTSKK